MDIRHREPPEVAWRSNMLDCFVGWASSQL
jgi:hypothetical protein